MDERSQLFIVRGMAITLALVYIFFFVSGIWKYVSTKDITSITWEIIFIVMIPASILWFARKDESLLIPKMITGENVPTTVDRESKKKRKTNYFLNSLGFATFVLIFTILDSLFIQDEWFYFTFFSQLSDQLKIIATLTVEFVIGLIVFYIVNYVWGELSVRKYKRKLDVLEDPDE